MLKVKCPKEVNWSLIFGKNEALHFDLSNFEYVTIGSNLIMLPSSGITNTAFLG